MFTVYRPSVTVPLTPVFRHIHLATGGNTEDRRIREDRSARGEHVSVAVLASCRDTGEQIRGYNKFLKGDEKNVHSGSTDIV